MTTTLPAAEPAVPEAARTAVRTCTRCLFDSSIPGIAFDGRGECSYCRLYEEMCVEYPAGDRGWARLKESAAVIKRAGRGKQFDVVVGVSGGCDSSYMVQLAKELGLRPLAVHFDNTWNSTTATENIHKVLKALDVELFTYVVDNEEYNDIYRAFMLSGCPDIEAPTDIGLAAVLFMAARKFGIRYQFEGHSFRTEGVSPLGWLYMDGKYIDSVVRAHGNYAAHRMRTYPNLTLGRMLSNALLARVKKIRPLYWIDYRKEPVKKMLTERYGWTWYGGHHLENRFTAFFHSYWLPRRYGLDTRINGWSALIRSGQMTREEALAELARPPHLDDGIIEVVKRRLRLSDAEFDAVMAAPKRTFRDYPNYKRTFERMRPVFWMLYRMDLVPKSFYVKYCAQKLPR